MDLKIGPALLLLAGWLIGSAPAVAEEPAVNTNAVIVYYDSSGNATLDPAEPQNGSSYSHETLLALYETVIRFDQDGNLTPGLAKSWAMSSDLTELTLHLRSGATFHDGVNVNADAIKRNFKRYAALGRRAGNVVADTARLIKTIDTIGEDKIKLTLTEPSGQIELRLAYNSGMMVSPASFAPTASGEAPFGSTLKGVGAGPYQLKSFDANTKTVMTRFDAYWAGTKGRPAGFEHHYVPESRARFNALRPGDGTRAAGRGRLQGWCRDHAVVAEHHGIQSIGGGSAGHVAGGGGNAEIRFDRRAAIHPVLPPGAARRYDDRPERRPW